MKRVIGAGLPRTGTTSLAAALEILGFGPILHGRSPGDEASCARLLLAKARYPHANAQQLLNLSHVSLAELTAPFNTTLDSPMMDFYAELSDLYPDNVVILSVRDSDEAWWRSWDSTLGPYCGDDFRGCCLRALIRPIWGLSDPMWMVKSYVTGWRQRYGCYGPLIHRRHNEEVVRRIPSDKLLVFNVKEGWEPLCRFLGTNVPNEPFPRLNDKATAVTVRRGLNVVIGMFWAMICVALACGFAAARQYSPMFTFPDDIDKKHRELE